MKLLLIFSFFFVFHYDIRKTLFKKVKYNYIDIMLLKNNIKYYMIQITIYRQSTNNILLFSHKIFWDLVFTNTLFKNSLIVILSVFIQIIKKF